MGSSTSGIDRKITYYQISQYRHEDAGDSHVGRDLGGGRGPDADDEDENLFVDVVQHLQLGAHPLGKAGDAGGLGQGQASANQEDQGPGHPVLDHGPRDQAGGGRGVAG